MTRIPPSILLVLCSTACATGGAAPRGERTDPEVRSVTMISSVDATGREISVPITTYSAGSRAVEVSASADTVFAVLDEVYEQLGIPVGTMDPPNRTAGNSQIRARGRLGKEPMSSYLDCGEAGLRGPAANTHPVRLSVLTTVTPSGAASLVRTVVKGVYSAPEQGGATACTSTGRLEAAILNGTTLRVARR